MKRIAQLISLLLLALAAGCHSSKSTPPPNKPSTNFAGAKTVLDAFRSGGESELVLSISANNVSILRPTTQALSESEAEDKLKTAKEAFPRLRFIAGDEVLSYPLDPRSSVEESTKKTKGAKSTWAIRNLSPVFTFPRDAWAEFVEFGLANGLSDLVVYQEKDELYGEMSFASSGPAVIPYGGQTVALNGEFYQTMRLSPKYPPSSGQKGFAVLIHDPHADVEGRYDLMLGLESFFSANPGKPMEFLVEGKCQKESESAPPPLRLEDRQIGDGGLFAYFNQTVSADNRQPLIARMLDRYLIDTPMAFRLLHSHDLQIPSYAIDDNRYLHSPTGHFGSRQETAEAVRTIVAAAKKLDGIPDNYKEMIATAGGEAMLLDEADLSNAKDVDYPDIMKRRGKAFEGLATIGKELARQEPQLMQSVEILQGRAQAYRNEAKVYSDALNRNIAMQNFIASEARKASARLPVAFIGSFHTEGITDFLRRNGIGYVVFEPRPQIQSATEEANQERFNNFLDNPSAYFGSLRTGNKGPSDLTQAQVDRYHMHFLEAYGSTFTQLRSAAEGGRPGSSQIDFARFWKSVQGNGDIASAEIEYGGNGGGTAPPPRGAFAYFEENNGKRKLVILDAESSRWKDSDRYDLLAKVRLVFPYSVQDAVPVVAMTRRHYEDKNTGRNFYSACQADTKRIYLVEADFPAIAAAMALPENKSNKDLDVHVTLSELEKGGFYNNGNDIISKRSGVLNSL